MSETETSIPAGPEHTTFARCDQCSAPVDEDQRYCIVCGARNKRAEDPVARYLAVASSRRRTSRASRAGGGGRSRAPGLGTAAVIAAIPLAVALGVIVGRANSGGDAKLISALRAQKAPVVKVTGGGAAATSAPVSVAAAAVASTFSLSNGYAVEIATIPVGGTSQTAVASAEAAAKAKGATGVGVISEKGFSVSPKPSGNVYIVYSGQYRTSAEAAAALAKLRRRFPAAKIISVRAVSAASASASTSSSTVRVKATKKQLAQGKSEVAQISHKTGKSYVQAQNNLPTSVSVP